MKLKTKQFATFDDIQAIVLVTDENGIIIFVNKAVEDILGYAPEELIGDGWWNVTSRENDHIKRKSDAAALARGELSVLNCHLHENDILTKDGRVVTTQWTVKRTNDGLLVAIAQDITQKKQLEQELIRKNNEKELLLKEIHHRVKNNLQIIISLLNLQFNTIEDNRVFEALTKSKDRIYSMALVHTKLCESENLSSIEFGDYINELVEFITSGYTPNNSIRCTIEHSNPTINIDLAVNLGLITTELVTNSLKHAFKERSKGLIKIKFVLLEKNYYQLSIEDNGVGMNPKSISDRHSLGLELVEALIMQIDGKLQITSNNGLQYRITFKSKPITRIRETTHSEQPKVNSKKTRAFPTISNK
ncbi:MAG: PAS domain S-box protein [Crocinitomicaceae bacterium]|nr:PAS domain S-box protein [Crocinitomicaceae bacterium]